MFAQNKKKMETFEKHFKLFAEICGNQQIFKKLQKKSDNLLTILKGEYEVLMNRKSGTAEFKREIRAISNNWRIIK